jgi:hypothetical protein
MLHWTHPSPTSADPSSFVARPFSGESERPNSGVAGPSATTSTWTDGGCRGSRIHAAIARVSAALYVARIAARRVLSVLAETRGSRRRSDSPQTGLELSASGWRLRRHPHHSRAIDTPQ